MRHGRRWHREGLSDAHGVEAQHDLEDKRGARRRVNRRMGAGEEHFQTPVGDRLGLGRAQGGHQLIVERRGGAPHGCPEQVAQTIASHRHQPALGVVRHAAGRPGPQGAFERIGKGIFSQGEVTRVGGEQRQ